MVCHAKNLYILLVFLVITMALLIAVSLYFPMKYRAKEKHLLPFHNINIIFKKLDF